MSFRAPAVERCGAGGNGGVPQPPLPNTHEDVPAVDPPKSVIANNMFKMPKGRSMRANYVDVMNLGGSKNSTAPPNMSTPVTSPLVPMATSSPQLFVPMPSKWC